MHDPRSNRSLTARPFGVNFTILENRKYKKQMEEWMEISVDEGVAFFLTSLGKVRGTLLL